MSKNECKARRCRGGGDMFGMLLFFWALWAFTLYTNGSWTPKVQCIAIEVVKVPVAVLPDKSP